MLEKVEFAEEATHEFQESVIWYESKAEGLGLRFMDEVDSTLERIRLNPYMYRKVAGDIRRIQMNRFPYSVFFRTENDILVVLRIFNNKRKPLQW